MEGYASIGLIVVVHWRWLSLLGLQVLLTTVFFVYVVVDTARVGVGVVKSSNMAELMVTKQPGTNTEDGPDGKDFGAGGFVSKVDGDLRGRLVRDGAGWHLEVQRQE